MSLNPHLQRYGISRPTKRKFMVNGEKRTFMTHDDWWFNKKEDAEWWAELYMQKMKNRPEHLIRKDGTKYRLWIEGGN